MTVRYRFALAACVLAGTGLAACLPSALAQVYRCDSPNGVPVYQGTPKGENCRPVDLQPLTTIPAPKLPAAQGAPAPSPASRVSSARPSPEGFPKVDAAAQRARDDDRRRILEDELQKEQARLDELKAEYKDGEPDRLGNERNYQKYLDRVARLEEDIARTESNIASLRRELSTIRP
ncbi:MAG TPA: DUF4124 domain-containing protein [Zeimonas sp.]|nr:DUF4124 domain-containing protein [Zeimonas sp.]